jgi:hypothetical protein
MSIMIPTFIWYDIAILEQRRETFHRHWPKNPIVLYRPNVDRNMARPWDKHKTSVALALTRRTHGTYDART